MKKKLLTAVLSVAMCLLLAGCGQTKEPVEPEMFACSPTISGTRINRCHIKVDNVDWGTSVECDAYSNFHVQVDDRENIVLGQTSIKEIIEMFRPDLNQDIEGQEPVKSDYSFRVLIGDDTKGADYQPIRLIDSEYKSKVTLVLYKYGVPYVSFDCYGGYAENKGITEEQNFVVSGISAAETNVAGFADTSGRNLYAKQNCWISGGYRLTGEGLDYSNIQQMLQEMGLTKIGDFWANDGYVNGYQIYSNGDDIYIEAKLRCSGIVDSNEKFYVPRTTWKFKVDDETQECTGFTLSMNEGLKTYSYDSYDAVLS